MNHTALLLAVLALYQTLFALLSVSLYIKTGINPFNTLVGCLDGSDYYLKVNPLPATVALIDPRATGDVPFGHG